MEIQTNLSAGECVSRLQNQGVLDKSGGVKVTPSRFHYRDGRSRFNVETDGVDFRVTLFNAGNDEPPGTYPVCSWCGTLRQDAVTGYATAVMGWFRLEYLARFCICALLVLTVLFVGMTLLDIHSAVYLRVTVYAGVIGFWVICAFGLFRARRLMAAFLREILHSG